jgi:imidazolonepropionase
MPDGDLLVRGIGELVTNAPDAPDLVGAVTDAAVLVRGGVVVHVGPARDLPDVADVPELDVGGAAVLPGFVDPHTHLVFAGDRADEFARRLRGERYEEVLASGGGINATVRATRAATAAELAEGLRERVRRMLGYGTTTIEVKSGYGLDVATERRCLEVVRAVGAEEPVDLVPTWLGAHLVPPEYADDRTAFLADVLPASLAACRDLAVWADVFCDEGAFTVEESRAVLTRARDAGLKLRIHADELAHSGGARLAAELGCRSADHLAHVDEGDARALAVAGTVATILPATTFSLRTHHYAPAAMLWDVGVTVALATDCNPGTSYTESMSFVVALACLEAGFTPEQAVWAATRGGALALDLDDRGHLVPGAVGDLIVLDAESYRHVPYRPGTNLVTTVVKRGAVVAG